MKHSIFTLLLITLLALTSCDELRNEQNDVNDSIKTCDFVYPISYKLADGTIVTLDDEDDKEDADHVCDKSVDDKTGDDKVGNDKTGDDKKSDVKDKDAKLQYPVQVITHTGKIVTVNNEKELKSAFEGCYKDDKGNDKQKDEDDDHDDKCG